MKTIPKIFLFFYLILFNSNIYAQQWKENFVQEILQLKKDPVFKHAKMGICLMNAADGKILLENNSQELMIPASTLKIITTASALGILGKNYRYETGLYYTGILDEKTGALNGNILIKGSGDPSLGSEYFRRENDSVTDVEKEFLIALNKKGIRSIKGKIVVDNSCFENDIPGDWTWSDIGNYYGAAAKGFSFRDNKFKIFFSSSEAGKKAKIDFIEPKGLAIELDNEVYSGGNDDNTVIFGSPDEKRRLAKGTIPAQQKKYEVEGSMSFPDDYFVYSFSRLLKINGIEIGEQNMENSNNISLICNHYSPSMEKLIYFCNLKSNNHYAESILKTIGLVKKGKGTLGTGIKAIDEFWKSRDIETDGLVMNDGSGLSRSNGITAHLQAQILSKIYRDSVLYNPFVKSLPVSGKSGSLINLGKGSCIEGNLRAKSGFITRVRAYCGYVKLSSGEDLCISFICNNYSCKPAEMKRKIETVLESLCPEKK